MNDKPRARTYTCSQHLRWVNDTHTTLVVDSHTLRAQRLEGVEAAVWRWLALSYPLHKAAAHLAQWRGIPVEDAHGQLTAMLEAWAFQGLLETAEDDDRG
jgi:hypothetical protein